jgi:precorrin-6B methylase 2
LIRRALLILLLGFGTAQAQEPEQVAPFVTTPSDVVVSMLRFAGTRPSDFVVDLGSGDGRIPITAATQFGAKGLGIEIDPSLVEASSRNARDAGVADRVRFVHGDVLQEDFSQATVVTVYLLPALINRLQPKLLDGLQPGTRIVSHAFAMVGWAPDRTHTLRIAERHQHQGDTSTVHLWVVPAKARGRWSGGGWEVVIHQNFQQIEVEARRDGTPVQVRNPRLSGRDIAWDAPGGRFSGRVEADAIRGTLAGAPLALAKR